MFKHFCVNSIRVLRMNSCKGVSALVVMNIKSNYYQK